MQVKECDAGRRNCEESVNKAEESVKERCEVT
jgi:hypothetical protein